MRRLALSAAIAAALAATAVAASLTVFHRGHAAGRTDGIPHAAHVFLIVGENTSASEITPVHAPYLAGKLKPASAWFPNYRSFPKSSSLGQYIAMVSGQYTKCEANNALPDHCHQRVGNLFSQLDATHRGWVDWEQSMTNACDPVDHGSAWALNIYSAHHNPALYFTQVQGGTYDEAIAPKEECRTRDIPTGTTAPNDTTALDAALRRSQLPSFSLIVPNDCANGHDPCGTSDHVREFDDFVAHVVPEIRSSPGFKRSDVIVVTWDEGNDPPKNPANPLLVISGGSVKPGVYTSAFDHYSLARTLEDMLAIGHLAHARTAPPISKIWN